MLDLNLLKLANIFGTGTTQPTFPSGGNSMMDTQPSSGSNQQIDLMSVIQNLLNPKDEQFNKFNDVINAMPQRSQYQPGKLRNIGAAMAGLGTGGPAGITNGQVVGYKSNIPEGIATQQAIRNEPYNKALSDWSNAAEPRAKMAQMEQSRNVNDRQLGLGALSSQRAQEKLDESERAALEKEAQGRKKLEISEERKDAYVASKKFMMDHPNHKPFVDENGDLFLYNPQDPNAKPVSTGLKKLSEMEKIDLGVQGQLKEITARGAESRKTDAQRAQEASDLEKQRYPNGRPKPGSTLATRDLTTKPLTPSAQSTDKINKAIAIINEHPELKQYFVYGGNKKPTGELINTPTENQPKADGFSIAQRLMGKDSDISLGIDVNPSLNIQPSSVNQPTRELTRPTNQSVESPQLASAKKKLEAGYVLITRDGGKTFSQIPVANINKLKPESGWVVVK